MKRSSWPTWRQLHGALPLVALLGVADCKTGHYAPNSAEAPLSETLPTARLVFVTDLGGALEPCGCTRDQLGGISHFAAWVSRERSRIPATVIASSGPQFFMEDRLAGDGADQARAKASAVAHLMHTVDWTAFAPASSDWSDGSDALARLAQLSGATPLIDEGGASRPPSSSPGDGGAALPRSSSPVDDAVRAPWTTVSVRAVGGLRVGFVGVSTRTDEGGTSRPPRNLSADDRVIASAETAVRRGFARAQAMGANAVVALASVGRGEAKRIADAVPELLAVVVGSAKAAGEQNVPASEPERVGNVLIVQAANHLQSVAVLDIYLRSPVESGVLVNLADGTGIELAASRAEIERRRGELRTKIAAWQRDPALRPSDLEARRRDLADLDVQAKRLYAPTESPKGNYYRYANQEIRDTLGSEPAAERELLAYYKAVNEHNRMAFAGRLPVPAGPTDATYVGDEVCATCHADARDVWARTPHATAYATLEKSFKEFNLDCVSCHVTGYELPGGSTVTHVDKLKNVQCEACHGPGSTHVLATPAAIHNVVAAPPPSRCLECHRPPHVENFDPATRMASILGPGHGLPKLK